MCKTGSSPEDVIRSATCPLLLWYGRAARDLPWRHDVTAYRVWVSEIMLQQTRVAAVIDRYRAFLAAFPDIPALAAANEDALLKAWQGLGYYSRARNLQKAAREIVERRAGVFPDSYEEILSLPGIGEYTAGAIASIAFSCCVPAVDGNVLRVLARLAGDDSDISLPGTKKRYRAAILASMPRENPGEFNQALMELGATVCVPNGAPDCEACPVCGHCAAAREDRTDALPVLPVRKPRRVEERRVYLVYRDGKVALRRRADKGLLAGMWEFPNDLASEPPLFPAGEPGPSSRHVFTHIEWVMSSVICCAPREVPSDWVFADAEEIRTRYAIPSAFAPFREEALRHMAQREERK